MATSTQAAPPKVMPTIDIQAQRMELLQKEGMIHFTGDVVVKQKSLELRCEALKAKYDKEGNLVELTARGQVRVNSPEWKAMADTAHYRRKADVLELRGKPRVRQGKNWLEGVQVTIHLDEERLVIEQARGQISAPLIDNVKTP